MANPSPISRFLLVVVAFAASNSLSPAKTARGATWTDLRGEHSIQADLVGIWGDQAILQKSDGTRISIPLLGLRSESRIQAEKLNEALVKHRQVRISELQGSAAEADAPAPKVLPTPAPTLAYKAPTADLPADVFMQFLNEQARAGHQLVVYYDGLPPSYRNDLDELFALATAKIDPTNWAALAKSLHDVGDLVITHQNWIFSHPRLTVLPEQTGLKLRDSLLALAGVLQTGFQADQVALEKLRTMKLRDYLAIQDQALSPHLAQLAQQTDSLSQIVVDATKADTATLTVTQGAQSQKFSVTKVEGFWVPTQWATTWQADMTTAKADLTAKSNGEVLAGGMTSMLVNSLGPLLAPLRDAKDATTFHLAMESMFQTAQPLVSMFASVDTSRFRLGGAAPAGYGNGYDESMNMGDYEEGMSNDYGSGTGDPGSGDPGGNPGSSYSSGGPPTNAMEASRQTAERASRSGTQGSGANQSPGN